MKTVEVTIKGMSALLMHAYPMQPIEGFDKLSVQDQAEHAAYRDPSTSHLYVPGMALCRALIAGATFSKGRGRASLQKMVAACLKIEPEKLDLGVSSYAIDSRPVTIPATKGRIMRHRPRLDSWQVQCTLSYDETLLSEAQVHRIMEDTGRRVGILDFRPERKGPFGTFLVTKWDHQGKA